MVKKVNKEQFDQLLKGEKPVVCDFYATWCGPCKMLAPVMEEVSADYPQAEFVKVDIDENMELAARYGIMSIPLVAVFAKGEEVGKTLGYMTKDEASDFLNENL